MFSSFEHNTVNTIFVYRKYSCCPSNAVTFGNSQNNALNGFPAIIGVHKDCIAILGKPLITAPATQQMSLIFAITSTSGNVSVPPDSILLTLWIRAKLISKVYHANLLSTKGFPIVPWRKADGKKKLTMIRWHYQIWDQTGNLQLFFRR